jgi:hypothetical protein
MFSSLSDLGDGEGVLARRRRHRRLTPMLNTSATRRFAVHRCTSSGTSAIAIGPSVAFGRRERLGVRIS